MTARRAWLLCVALASACGGGSSKGVDGGGGAVGGTGSGICAARALANNSAVCDVRLGRGTADNATLAKAVPVTLAGSDYEASVGYVTRSSATSTYTSFVIPITNVSATTRCFISVLSGQAGTYSLVSYADGSVGYSGTVYTQTCLAPSEQGYLMDITNEVAYDGVSSISLALGDAAGMTISIGQVFPQSATYVASTSRLEVSLRNTGTLTVRLVGGFHRFIPLDDADRALDFSFMNPAGTTDLAPGASDTLTDTTPFSGRASRAVVLVDFEGVGPTGALNLAASPEDRARLDAALAHKARLRTLWRQRN